MNLDDHVSALREAGEPGAADDVALASATRLRVRESIAHAGRSRARFASVAAGLGVLLVATASWALATGELQKLWRGEPAPVVTPTPTPSEPAIAAPVKLATEPVPALAPSPVEPPAVAPAAPIASIVPRAPAVSIVPPTPVAPPINRSPHVAQTPAVPVTVAPAPVAPTPPASPGETPAPPAPAPAATVDAPPVGPIEALYQRAHDLYFHGSDYAAALAAWDAYLAAEPNGRFTIEARYNRALCLVRLGKLADARAALAPFARGEVEPRGYRQVEATALVARIAKRLGH